MSNHLPPLNALRAFAVAGRHLNFTAAAGELGVTQGAVAQHVRGLEANLGVRLFLREPRGLSLTSAGRLYHEGICRAFEQFELATAVLRPSPSKVTISVTPTFASKWLIPKLPEFTARYPDIDLRVLATESVLSFRADAIDLAVRQGSPPFGASLDAALVFTQEIISVCSVNLRQNNALPMSRDELAQCTLLHDAHNLWPRYIESAFGDAPPLPAKGMHFNQTTLSLDAAIAGQGIALASRFLVQRDLQAGRLVQPMDMTINGGQNFYLLAPRHARKLAHAGAVREWILDESRA